MEVLVTGKGGREHALVHTVNRGDRVKKIYAAPGDPGAAELTEYVSIADSNVRGLTTFAKEQETDLTIAGPKAALSLGIVNTLQAEGLKIFGPTKDVAQMESSKDFAKKIIAKYDIPTISYQTLDNKVDAIDYVEHQSILIVIKEDSLKAGKGVTVAYELKEALDAIEIAFSAPGDRVVIKEYLEGSEFSSIRSVCSDLALPMEIIQDHKVAYNGDKGSNTSGMGVYSPVKRITPDVIEEAMNTVMTLMAKAMMKGGHPFTGLLYGGLMLTRHDVRTVEFNVRFGDPKAKVILLRLKTDFYDVIENTINHSKTELEWDDRVTLGVIMVSEGYLAPSTKGAVVENLKNTNSMVSHMRTAEKGSNLATDDGHVLCVCVAADTLEEVYEKVYADVRKIHYDELLYRDGIGEKGM